MTADDRLDVVVLTWNDGDLLKAALESVLASEWTGELTLFVVDNASEPPAVVPPDRRVRLVRNLTNRGVAGGRNDGIAHGSAPYICILDSDAVLDPSALLALAAPLQRDQSIAMAVPVFIDQAPEASAGRAPSVRLKVRRMLGWTDRYESAVPTGEEAWDVEFGIGACQMFRRSVYEEVGGLDETMYWTEDVDFCLRVRDAGHRIVQVAPATVHHPPRREHRSMLTLRGVKHGVAFLRFVLRHRRW